MATVKENLIAAKALIDAPEKWGRGLDGPNPCVIMAVEIATRSARRTAYSLPEYKALDENLPAKWVDLNGRGSVGAFNDNNSHADIMALFDRAIEAQP